MSAPSPLPTRRPTTSIPSRSPTALPTTARPTLSPTETPTNAPTETPTAPTTLSPTSQAPSQTPTTSPTITYARPVILAYTGPNVVRVQEWNLSPSSLPNTNGTTVLYSIQTAIGTKTNATCVALVNTRANVQRFTIARINNTFAYSTSAPSALPLTANDTLPLGLSLRRMDGSITGTVRSVSDLTTFPITCVSFPRTIAAPVDYEAVYVNSTAMLVRAWGRSGFVDPATGLMDRFWSSNSTMYPANESQPYFCSPFWVGVNSFEADAYQPDVISVAFHSVRNPNQPYMIFSDNSQFSSYELALLFGAIPFWALTLACIIMYPSLICYSKLWVCRYLCDKYCSCGYCLKPIPQKGAIPRSTSSLGARKAKPSSCRTRFAKMCCCCRKKRGNADAELSVPAAGSPTDTTASATTEAKPTTISFENDEPAFDDLSTKGDDDDVDSDVDGLTQDEAEEADLMVRKYQKQINRILASPHISKRFCFLFVLIFACGCISALLAGFFQAIASFSEEYATARDFMGDAYNSSMTAYALLNDELNKNRNTSEIYAILEQERDRVARFASLANPSNLRMSARLFPTYVISPQVQIILESVIFAIQIVAPIMITLSLVLASCTCKWNEYVLLENLSIGLGMSIQGYLLLCATLAWFIVMFFFWNVSVVSDVCFMPSVIYVPEFNSTQGALLQAPIPYDPNSNNYVLPNGQNLVKFYWNCQYNAVVAGNVANTVANPYPGLANQANQLNAQAKTIVSPVNLPLRTLLNRLESLYSQMISPMGCSAFGQVVTQGTNVFCTNVLIGNFLTFFFLCTLGITYMIVAPCTHWISPNLYRQWQANKIYERGSLQTERLIKMATLNAQAMRRDLDAHHNISTKGFKGDLAQGSGKKAASSAFSGRRPRLRNLSKSKLSQGSGDTASFKSLPPTTEQLGGTMNSRHTMESIPSDPFLLNPPISVSTQVANSTKSQRRRLHFFGRATNTNSNSFTDDGDSYASAESGTGGGADKPSQKMNKAGPGEPSASFITDLNMI